MLAAETFLAIVSIEVSAAVNIPKQMYMFASKLCSYFDRLYIRWLDCE